MKKTTLLSIAAVFVLSLFFGQTTNAKSVEAKETSLDICRVKKPNSDFFVTATEKTIKLRKGTQLKWTIPDLHQGLIVVKAKVGTKWVAGEILMEDTTCS